MNAVKEYRPGGRRTSIFLTRALSSAYLSTYRVQLTPGEHGPGKGPSFPPVATAPAIEKAVKTMVVYKRTFAVALFISPPQGEWYDFFISPDMCNKRLDLIGFPNLENQVNTLFKNGQRL
jgi:hypothetical protein